MPVSACCNCNESWTWLLVLSAFFNKYVKANVLWVVMCNNLRKYIYKVSGIQLKQLLTIAAMSFLLGEKSQFLGTW